MKKSPFSRIFWVGMLLTVSHSSIGAPVDGTPQRSTPSTPTQSPYTFQARTMRAVWPHELMSIQERHELWLKMRTARTPAERMELWAKKYAQLEERSAKLGVVLREPEPMMMRYEDRYPGMREEGRWGPERREYAWPGEHPSYRYGARYGVPHYEGLPQRYENFRPLPPAGR
ncbi:exported hypothetical protein [Gammaproteobacteria bacterium]